MPQGDLFNQTHRGHSASWEETLELGDHTLRLIHGFLTADRAERLLHTLERSLNWEQPEIRIAGQTLQIPRLQAWLGAEEFTYRYSAQTFKAKKWPEEISELNKQIEDASGYAFNSALCNLYRSGADSVAWHADDEAELGNDPVIASYSLGETRVFQLKPKAKHSALGGLVKLPLEHNSLLIMPAGLQRVWQHQLPKTRRLHGARINLTFRKIWT